MAREHGRGEKRRSSERGAQGESGERRAAPEAIGNRATLALIRARAQSAAHRDSTGVADLGSGRSLDSSIRAEMELRFGERFDGVRVFAGERAARAAGSQNANAYTVGRDIVFGENQYAPGTDKGKRLLAHELTHVVQQQRGHGHGSRLDHSDRECEADRAADHFSRGAPVTVVGAAPHGMQKQGNGLIDVETVGRVWGEKVDQVAKEMKLSPDDPKVRAEAEKRTSFQIGPGNYQNWVKQTRGGVGITLEPATQIEMEKKLDEEAIELPTFADGTPWSSGAVGPQLAKQANDLFDRTDQIRRDVVRMEHECEKLRTPGGVEGGLYQYVGGALTMVAGPTLGTLDQTIGLPIEKGIAAITGHKSTSSLGTIADDQVGAAVSGYQLMTGDLNDRYNATRPSYARFLKAQSALDKARTALRTMGMNGDIAAEYDKAVAAKNEMFDAYREYADKCAALNIKGKAKQLERGVDQAAQGIVSGMASTIPLFGPSTKAATKLLQATEIALEKAALDAGETAVTQIAKKAPAVLTTVGEDAVVVGTKAEGKATTNAMKGVKPPPIDDLPAVRSRPGAGDILDEPLRAPSRSPTAQNAHRPFFSRRGNRVPMGTAGEPPLTVPKPRAQPPKEWVKAFGKEEATKAAGELEKVADLPGSEGWVKDLSTANNPTTTVGTRGEMRVAAVLREAEVPIEKVADTIGGKKAGDILTPGRVIDVKTLTIDESYLKLPKFIKERQIQEMVAQAKSWATRYPGRKPVYIFEGMPTEGIPPDMRAALQSAGVDVRGSLSDLADLAKPPVE